MTFVEFLNCTQVIDYSRHKIPFYPVEPTGFSLKSLRPWCPVSQYPLGEIPYQQYEYMDKLSIGLCRPSVSNRRTPTDPCLQGTRVDSVLPEPRRENSEE